MKNIAIKILIGCFIFFNTELLAQPLTTKILIQDKVLIEHYNRKATEYYYANDLDSMIFCANKMYFLAKKYNLTQYYSFYYDYYGSYHKLKKKDLDTALFYAKLGAKFAKKNKQDKFLDRINYRIACLYTDKKNFLAAIKQVFENVRAKNTVKDDHSLISNYSLLSNLYLYLGIDSLETDALNECVKILKKKHSRVGLYEPIALPYYSCYIHIKNHDSTQANQYIHKVIDFIVNKKKGYKNKSSWLSDLALNSVKYNYSNGVLLILPLLTKQDFSQKNALYNLYLTTIYLHKKQYHLARITYNKSIKFFSPYPFGYESYFLGIELILAEHEKKYKEALAIEKKIHLIDKNRFNNVSRVDILIFQEKINKELEDLSLDNITKKNKIQQLENQKKQGQLDEAKEIILLTLSVVSLLVSSILLCSFLLFKLNKQTQRLRASIEHKNRLFSIIGHDLRSPIISLLAHFNSLKTSNLKKDIWLDPWANKQLSYMNTLLLTVNNLLYWAVSQNKKIQLSKQDIYVTDIVEEVLEEFTAYIDHAELNVVKVYQEIGEIIFDDNHLKIIVRNIIHNAIKFTPKGGSIFISVVENDTPVLIIRDTGIGFENSTKSVKNQSTKLGLELVKELVNANESRILFENVNEGGTQVSIFLTKKHKNLNYPQFLDIYLPKNIK